jgi:hypothetical protein
LATIEQFKKVFGDLIIIKGENHMKGTISKIREKEGKQGKYLTLALADGTKGLVVNNPVLFDKLRVGAEYEFDVEIQGIFTIVNDAKLISSQPAETKTTTVTYAQQGEYQRQKHPVEQAIIAAEAFLKSSIEAYAKIWASGQYEFKSLDDFDDECQQSAKRHLAFLADTIRDFNPSGNANNKE